MRQAQSAVRIRKRAGGSGRDRRGAFFDGLRMRELTGRLGHGRTGQEATSQGRTRERTTRTRDCGDSANAISSPCTRAETGHFTAPAGFMGEVTKRERNWRGAYRGGACAFLHGASACARSSCTAAHTSRGHACDGRPRVLPYHGVRPQSERGTDSAFRLGQRPLSSRKGLARRQGRDSDKRKGSRDPSVSLARRVTLDPKGEPQCEA